VFEEPHGQTNIHRLLSPGKLEGGADPEVDVQPDFKGSLSAQLEQLPVDVQSMRPMSGLGPDHGQHAGATANVDHVERATFAMVHSDDPEDGITNRGEAPACLRTLALTSIVFKETIVRRAPRLVRIGPARVFASVEFWFHLQKALSPGEA
jgi:hypothetical protein